VSQPRLDNEDKATMNEYEDRTPFCTWCRGKVLSVQSCVVRAFCLPVMTSSKSVLAPKLDAKKAGGQRAKIQPPASVAIMAKIEERVLLSETNLVLCWRVRTAIPIQRSIPIHNLPKDNKSRDQE
jgi:hypothetical protein